nr:MarR family transcriptional regulator [uncultured Oscillibacter sp.]
MASESAGFAGGVMDSEYKGKDISDILDNLDEKIDIVFRHQMLFSLYRSIPRDYGDGVFMSEVDVHMLGFIEDEPGIIAKKLADMTYRTKGTISSSLSRLEKDGYIEQRVNPENRSERNLFLTEKGMEVCRRHHEYDRKVTYGYILRLLEYCTPEEINGFFKVSHYRSDFFEDVIRDEKAKYEAYCREKRRKTGDGEA